MTIDNHSDRMAITRRRGPPSRLEMATPPPMPLPAEVVDIPQPPLRGIRPPCCGRAMVPRRTGGADGKTYASCTFCGAALAMTFDGDRVFVRLVR